MSTKRAVSRLRSRRLALAAEQVKEQAIQARAEREAMFRKLVLGPSGKLPEDEAGRKEYLDQLAQTRLKKQHRLTVGRILADPDVARAFAAHPQPLSLYETLQQAPSAGPETLGNDQPPPIARAILEDLCRQFLILTGPPPEEFATPCGIFELWFTPRSRGEVLITTAEPLRAMDDQRSTVNEASVRLELPADIAERLDKACRLSGLTRGEVVAELMRRQNPNALLEGIKVPQP
jgi:hypothetical protein